MSKFFLSFSFLLWASSLSLSAAQSVTIERDLIFGESQNDKMFSLELKVAKDKITGKNIKNAFKNLKKWNEKTNREDLNVQHWDLYKNQEDTNSIGDDDVFIEEEFHLYAKPNKFFVVKEAICFFYNKKEKFENKNEKVKYQDLRNSLAIHNGLPLSLTFNGVKGAFGDDDEISSGEVLYGLHDGTSKRRHQNPKEVVYNSSKVSQALPGKSSDGGQSIPMWLKYTGSSLFGIILGVAVMLLVRDKHFRSK